MIETDSDGKLAILFVCNHNSARSQMAEGLVKHMYPAKYDAYSAGLTPGPSVHPLAVEVMKEIGVDISTARPKGFDDFIGRDFDYVVSVCDAHAEECPAVISNTVPLNFGFPDPARLAAATEDREAQLNFFRICRDQIRQTIKNFVLINESQIRRSMSPAEKKQLQESYYARTMQKALRILQDELMRLPHPEPLVCILGAQLRNLLLRRLPQLRHREAWPLFMLVIAMLAAATRTDFPEFALGRSYWQLAFVIGFVLSLAALLYVMISNYAKKDVHKWTEDLIDEIRFRERQ